MIVKDYLIIAHYM